VVFLEGKKKQSFEVKRSYKICSGTVLEVKRYF